MFIEEIGHVIYQPVKIEEGIYASPSSFRLEMREFMKSEMSDKYFKINEFYKPAKNFGCYLFGQKDVWKGIVGIKIEKIYGKTNKSEISIVIDNLRINQNIKKEVTETIKELLNKMAKKYDFVQIKEKENNNELNKKNGIKKRI